MRISKVQNKILLFKAAGVIELVEPDAINAVGVLQLGSIYLHPLKRTGFITVLLKIFGRQPVRLASYNADSSIPIHWPSYLNGNHLLISYAEQVLRIKALHSLRLNASKRRTPLTRWSAFWLAVSNKIFIGLSIAIFLGLAASFIYIRITPVNA